MQVGWAGGARRHRFPVVTLSRLSWRLYLRERALEGRFDSRFDRVDRCRWFRPLAGERDAIHPPATVRETARRVGASVQVMAAMSHWLPDEPGWEDVANACLAWAAEIGTPLAAAE